MEVPEHLRNYIDYEAYGRDIALEEGGQFTEFGYVRETGDSFHEYYDGDRDSIPEEYRVMNFKEASQHDLEYPPEHNASEKLTVLVVEPGKEPYEKEIEPGLRSLQTEVGGDIAAVYPFDDPVALVLNDEGKLIGLDLNRALRDEQGEIYDIVAGTFLVMGLGEEDFASIF